MQCPIDNTPLVMSDRQGIEIDYCPKCRGVWLDRGELDKIIERSVPATAPVQQAAAPPPYRDDRSHGYSSGKPYKKRESFLGELFDF